MPARTGAFTAKSRLSAPALPKKSIADNARKTALIKKLLSLFTKHEKKRGAIGLGAFALIVTSAIFRAATLYAITRWVTMRMHSLSERLLKTYLRQPYAYFLNRHSADMSKTILSEAAQVANGVIKPGMSVLAHGTVLIVIILLFVVLDLILALAVAGEIGGAYAAVYVSVRGFLGWIGKNRVRANKERFITAGEALGGIEDVKLLGHEHAYLSRFRGP